MNGEELEQFLDSLAADKEEIEELFDYLETKLERNTQKKWCADEQKPI